MDQLTIDDLACMLGQRDMTIRMLERKVTSLLAENMALKQSITQADDTTATA